MPKRGVEPLLTRPFRNLRRFSRRLFSGVAIRRDSDPQLADRGYMICSTARSGSTYFDKLLANTGVLGRPREYFNFPVRRRQNPDYPSDPWLQLRIIRTMGATANGIYGVKAFPRHLVPVQPVLDPFRELPDLRFVRLIRRDVLGQAISLVRAMQTKQFHASAKRQGEPNYDRQAIETALQRFHDENRIWDGIMRELGRQPLVIEYEAVCVDPEKAVNQVAALMDLPLPLPPSQGKNPFKILRDDLSAEWRRRFLDETGDRFRDLGAVATPPSPPGSASAS